MNGPFLSERDGLEPVRNANEPISIVPPPNADVGRAAEQAAAVFPAEFVHDLLFSHGLE
jgi:hypothetical protein